jgi:hypothetical protein
VVQSAMFQQCVVPLVELANSLRSWRNQQIFVQHFQHFHKYFSSVQIIDKFVPLLFKQMAMVCPSNYVGPFGLKFGIIQSALPVKEAACFSLCTLLRKGVKHRDKRREICHRLISDFAKYVLIAALISLTTYAEGKAIGNDYYSSMLVSILSKYSHESSLKRCFLTQHLSCTR